MMESFDCVVIGAGWFGLGAAKQYRVQRPDHTLCILDSQSSVGGTWATERLYPNLRSNSLFGTFEFPDFPMDKWQHKETKSHHIPGEIIQQYMHAYAAHFRILPLIRFESSVTRAERMDSDDGGWMLTVKTLDIELTMIAKKLIVATGLTSEPRLPNFIGQADFGGQIIHGKQFSKESHLVESARAITVYGCSKFCWDAVYTSAKSGREVHWVVPTSGRGPPWSVSREIPFLGFKSQNLLRCRPLSWLSPCVWSDEADAPRIREFLHNTWIGGKVVLIFWKILELAITYSIHYKMNCESVKLRPWTPLFFAATSVNPLNWDEDIMQLIQTAGVKVYYADILHLSEATIHLSSGSNISSDLLFAHTGWLQSPPVKFVPEGLVEELGLPCLSNDDTYHELRDQADQEIVSRFPYLKHRPKSIEDYLAHKGQAEHACHDGVNVRSLPRGFLLHRFMVPTSQRLLQTHDIAFCGLIRNPCAPITAYIQGLWTAAYLNGNLNDKRIYACTNQKQMQKIEYEAVLHNRFGIWRHPIDWGTGAPDILWDLGAYFGLLLRDLGTDEWKRGGWLSPMLKLRNDPEFEKVSHRWIKEHCGH